MPDDSGSDDAGSDDTVSHDSASDSSAANNSAVPPATVHAAPHGPIRSFVRRIGRISDAQSRAFAEHSAQFCIPFTNTAIDLTAAFGRTAPLLVEIGSGMGHALLETAAARRDWNHLGIEVHRPGVAAVIKGALERGLTNIRMIEADAVQVLASALAIDSVQQLHIFFPDPWPKARHHKRRLLQPPFVRLAASRLVAEGRLLLATDWQPYAEAMLAVLDEEPLLINDAGRGNYSVRPAERPITRFERRGLALGHAIADLIYRRVPGRDG